MRTSSFHFILLLLVDLVSAANFASASEECAASERHVLLGPKFAVSLPPSIEGHYTELSITNNEPRIQLDFVDSVGARNYVYWEPRVYVTATISCEVAKATHDTFSYMYRLTNGSTARQSIAALMIEVKSPVSEILKPANTWESRILSVDVWKRRIYKWWASPESQPTGQIAPGESTGGFELKSKGHPTVVPCWAAGQGMVPHMERELPGPIEAILRKTQGLLDDAVSGVTVGPREAPPTLLDLQEYLQVSVTQGWVCEGEPHDTLKALLDEAVKSELAGDRLGTTTSLRKLLSLITEYFNASPAKTTSEVEALLGVNASWLIENPSSPTTEVEGAKEVVEK